MTGELDVQVALVTHKTLLQSQCLSISPYPMVPILEPRPPYAEEERDFAC